MDFVSSINIIDVIVVLLLIFFCYRGFVAGFVNILFDSLAIIVSFYAANQYAIHIKTWMAEYLKFTVPWAGFASYVLVYLLSFLFFILWGRLITKVFKMSAIGLLNSLSGLVLNFLKWSLLLLIVLMVVEKITIDSIGKYMNESYVYQAYATAAEQEFLKEFIPNLSK